MRSASLRTTRGKKRRRSHAVGKYLKVIGRRFLDAFPEENILFPGRDFWNEVHATEEERITFENEKLLLAEAKEHRIKVSTFGVPTIILIANTTNRKFEIGTTPKESRFPAARQLTMTQRLTVSLTPDPKACQLPTSHDVHHILRRSSLLLT